MLPAQVSYWTLQENKRHNIETEDISRRDLEERIRHNREDERIRFGTLEETTRNNLYLNRQGDYSLGLNTIDTETRRFAANSNAKIGMVNAIASVRQAGAAETNAAANMLNAGTNQAVGQSTIDLNEARRTNEILGGYTTRALQQAQAGQASANAAKTQKDTEYVDFYAEDRAKQTHNQTVTTGINAADRLGHLTLDAINTGLKTWEIFGGK